MLITSFRELIVNLGGAATGVGAILSQLGVFSISRIENVPRRLLLACSFINMNWNDFHLAAFRRVGRVIMGFVRVGKCLGIDVVELGFESYGGK